VCHRVAADVGQDYAVSVIEIFNEGRVNLFQAGIQEEAQLSL